VKPMEKLFALKPKWVFVLVSGVALFLLPFMTSNAYVLDTGILAFTYGILAASWDLLSGYTGQLSFGHAGFFAIGAYAAGILTLRIGLSPWLGLLAGGLLTGVLGALIGLPILRVRGHFLAIVTLGFSEIIRRTAHNLVGFTGGPYGLYGYDTFPGVPADPEAAKTFFYFTGFILLVFCGVVMYWICEKTQIGKAFKSIREDELLAEALGINTKFYKVVSFSISCFFAGVAGSFYAYYIQLVSPWVADPLNIVLVIGMVIFGGLGTLVGPIYGALLLYSISQGLRFVGVVYNLIMLGFIIVFFIIFIPNGLWGMWKHLAWKARSFADRQSDVGS